MSVVSANNFNVMWNTKFSENWYLLEKSPSTFLAIVYLFMEIFEKTIAQESLTLSFLFELIPYQCSMHHPIY